MGTTFSFAWEVTLMQWLQAAFSAMAGIFGTVFSLFGEELVLVVVSGFLYWCRDKRWGKTVAFNFLAVLMAGPLVKNLVLRRRPYMDHPGIRCLRPVEPEADLMDIAAQGYSFPSMHASNTLGVYGSLAMCVRKRRFTVLMAVLVFCIGFSRLLVGVHYPTDVLAGWALGALLTWVVSALQKKIESPLVFAGIFALLSLPGWFFCTSSDFFSAYGLMLGLLVGMALEEKYVRFENTRQPVRCILRVLGGVAVFAALDILGKLPFSDELLNGADFAAHFVRALRYAVMACILIFVYPILFRYTAKLGKKKSTEE